MPNSAHFWLALAEIEIDSLRAFVAVAEAGGFTAAGARLGRTQSAVSVRIRRLEEVLGRRVFARTSRSLALTRDGELPNFGADGGRVFVNVAGDDKMELVSLELDGSDVHTHVKTDNATALRVSPDGQWLAWNEGFHGYIAPFPATGRTVELGPKAESVPVTKVKNSVWLDAKSGSGFTSSSPSKMLVFSTSGVPSIGLGSSTPLRTIQSSLVVTLLPRANQLPALSTQALPIPLTVVANALPGRICPSWICTTLSTARIRSPLAS